MFFRVHFDTYELELIILVVISTVQYNDGQQFHQYQQNEQSTLNSLNDMVLSCIYAKYTQTGVNGIPLYNLSMICMTVFTRK